MNNFDFRGRLRAVAMTAILGVGLATPGWSQGGYHVGESTDQSQTGSAGAEITPAQASGPVRMARFSFLKGRVTWRPDPNTEWADATNNLPLREGSEVWVGDGGRAELQFDDGSVIRFGSGAVAILQTMFSDAQGEFTEIKLTDGLASMDLRTNHSIYQIDTPKGAVKSTGPSLIRVGVDDDMEVGVREGLASIDGLAGKIDLRSGDYVDLSPNATSYEVQKLPQADSWDKFTDERHALLSHEDTNLPENLRFVAGDLQAHGDWRDDAEYGHVWAPRVPDDWKPYTEGHFVWCDPFGWTWVGSEEWGWAPYHYGSWIHRGWGWAWVPGPVNQYWSPAVVNFSYLDDNVCWTPLAPWECHYPSAFGLGTWGFGWSSWFSIGFCGAWFAGGDDWCGEHRWNNGWVNRWHGDHGHHGGLGAGGFASRNGFHFHPSNAAFVAATATRSSFANGGRYTLLSGRQAQSVFERGQTLAPPVRGTSFIAGPSNIRPTSTSWTGSRSFARAPGNTSVLGRPVFRGTTPNPGSSRGASSRADAARAARQSLGWSRGSSAGNYSGYGSSRSGGSYGSGRTGFGSPSGAFPSRSFTSPNPQARTRGSWTVPDRGGWSHVHHDMGGYSGARGGGSIPSGGGSHGSGGSFGGGGGSAGASGGFGRGGRGH